jgi:DGQHR domain-containing protein
MKSKKIAFDVIIGRSHGVEVYRGFGEIKMLSQISKADVYDQLNNPLGTQRDLSVKHAKEAYQYLSTNEFGYWPEVFLSARNPDVMTFIPDNEGSVFGRLEIDLDIALAEENISISRVDGNHRLYFAGGIDEDYEPLDVIVSFSIAYNLTREHEIRLFRDINANSKSMNTSHLDNIEYRLDEKDSVEPDLFIAFELGRDTESPLYKMVFEGGVKPEGFTIPERTLRNGIRYMLAKSNKLGALSSKAQYELIKNYFKAVREWVPAAWDDSKSVIILRGAGLWATCYIGADVIDRVLMKNNHSAKDMLKILKSGNNWDWSGDGVDFRGLSGAGGASEIAKKVVREFKDDKGVSLSDLEKTILKK